jgi:hypothetical protein
VKRLMGVLALASAAGVSGCSDHAGDCTPDMVMGLVIFVVDGQTGAPICDATVTARDGAYSETLARSDSAVGGCDYFGASERAGTYSVRAEAAGFSPSTVSDVKVRAKEDDCHVETARRTMRLEPQAPPPS